MLNIIPSSSQNLWKVGARPISTINCRHPLIIIVGRALWIAPKGEPSTTDGFFEELARPESFLDGGFFST